MGTVGLRTKLEPPVISSSDNRDERYDWPGRRHEESSLLGFATAEVAEGAVVGTVCAESDMVGIYSARMQESGGAAALFASTCIVNTCSFRVLVRDHCLQ